MSVWESPYENKGSWYKGAIHIHTDNSPCGKYPLEKVVDTYGGKQLGYDFLVITDHDRPTDAGPFQGRHGMVLIPGVEESFGMSHIVAVNTEKSYRFSYDDVKKLIDAVQKILSERKTGPVYQKLKDEFCGSPAILETCHVKLADTLLKNKGCEGILSAKMAAEAENADYQGIINRIADNKGLAILAHPHWLCDDYWDKKLLDELYNYSGIEIYSGDLYAPVTNVATDTWDSLLGAGKRVWGFGGDDFHEMNEFCRVWNVVNSEHKNRQGLVDALRRGDFYVSTGLWLSEIKAEEDKVTVSVKNDGFTSRFIKIFRFIGKGGEVLHEQSGKKHKAVYTARGDEGYVRAHIMLETGQMAYTQPFFLMKR